MVHVADEVVVVDRRDYSETSQIIVFFGRKSGKFRAIAKGVRRGTKTRFAVGLDLLDIGRSVYSTRGDRPSTLATLIEIRQSGGTLGLRDRLESLNAALYTAEVTVRLTEDWDPHPDLFDALIETITSLARGNPVLPAVVDYQVRLLDAIGSSPRLDDCVVCGRSTPLTHFSSFDGGMICRSCEASLVEKREVSAATRTTLSSRTSGGTAELTETPPDQWVGPFALLNYHLSHLIGAEPRLARSLVPPAGLRSR